MSNPEDCAGYAAPNPPKPHPPKKVQRIKMGIYKHPVKLDGTVIGFATDGSCFTVDFDGPYQTTTFYRYRETLISDKPLDECGEMVSGANLWTVYS